VSAAPPQLRWTVDPGEVAGAIALRQQVFCVEQGVSASVEVDELDAQADHLLGQDAQGRVVATLRLVRSGERAKVGRVAVERSRRREGIALRMLAMALERAASVGCTEAVLASQVYAVPLYERAGFAVCSEEFVEEGLPHVWMTRPLTPAAPRASA